MVGRERGPWSPNFEASAELIRRLDPTRPRLFSHGQYDKYQQMQYGPMEVDSWHYPGPGGPGRAANSPRPVIFDEYCHLNTYNREETVTDPGLRDAWGRKFAAMWEAMVASEGCLGGALWAGIDEVYLLPEREVGWGAWGPIDSWYRPKPEYWHVKKVYSPVRIPNEPLAVPKAGEPICVPVVNRHDFTNLNELTVRWSLADETGAVTADIPPRAAGTLAIHPRSTELAGQTLELTFHSPRGFLIDTFEFPVGKVETPAATNADRPAAGPLQVREADHTITLTGRQVVWQIDRHTGMIRSVQAGGRTVLVGGPTLMILPLKGGQCAEPTTPISRH